MALHSPRGPRLACDTQALKQRRASATAPFDWYAAPRTSHASPSVGSSATERSPASIDWRAWPRLSSFLATSRAAAASAAESPVEAVLAAAPTAAVLAGAGESFAEAGAAFAAPVAALSAAGAP